MKSLKDRHKKSAAVMCASAAICMWSGKRKKFRLHKYSAWAMCISGAVCMYTGCKMLRPKSSR